MRTLIAVLLISTLAMLAPVPVHADGVMRPVAKAYPEDLLRHRSTAIDVTFNGQIALTTVTQEFVNEWYLPTDVVYSFPLPLGARATDFLFWSNDTLYRAPLKVKEQATNPGTGEGGIDALLANYLGANSIRVFVGGVPAGRSQRIILTFITLCRYDAGRIVYRYPLNSDIFATSPVEDVSATFHINATDDITGYSLDGIGGATTVQHDARHATITAADAKVYLTRDLTFSYTAPSSVLGHDLFASRTAARGGHFVMMLKTGPVPDSTALLPKTIVFMIDRSTATAGLPFQTSRDAILDCLGRLRTADRFNVIAFNSGNVSFRNAPVPATTAARDSAVAFLAGLGTTGYSYAGQCITQALATLAGDTTDPAIMVFTDGLTITAPAQVATANTAHAAILPIAISASPATARVETIAYQNYGFPTFLKPTDPVLTEVRWVFDQLRAPIIKDTRLEMGARAFDLYPRDLRTVYAGVRFFLTGRYTNPGTSPMTLGGQSAGGPTIYSALLTLPSESTDVNVVESFWAKEKIDQLERQIAISGATDSMKAQLIALSLSYGIRCMYTAYIADKSLPVSGVDETAVAVQAFTAEMTPEGVRLSWSLSPTALVRSVRVLRAETRDGEYVPLAEGIEGMSERLDAGPGAATAWYRLEIITRSGERLLSEPVSAEGTMVPTRTRLLPNYPNPFNPSTTIRYAVAGTGPCQVILGVYDVLGRRIRTLIDGVQPAGEYLAVWDGTDDHGRSVASGTYFGRLQVGPVVDSRMMLLAR